MDLPAKNIDQWVLPLDSYVLGDTRTFDYAENLLIEPCMEKAGYAWKVPYRDITSTDGPSWNAVQRRLFNPAIARQWGFHLAPSPDTTLEATRAFAEEDIDPSPAKDAAFDRCLKEVRKTLPVWSSSTLMGANFASRAYDGALADDKVKATAARWRTCMKPAGVSDLPETPEDFPSDSVESKFDIKLEVSHTPPVVSAAEIALATFEADCEVSSGYQGALYEAEWDRQAKALAENADDLKAVKAELDALKARNLKVISTHAPKR